MTNKPVDKHTVNNSLANLLVVLNLSTKGGIFTTLLQASQIQNDFDTIVRCIVEHEKEIEHLREVVYQGTNKIEKIPDYKNIKSIMESSK